MISKSAIDEFHNRNLDDWSWLKEVPESELWDEIYQYYPTFKYTLKPFNHQLASLLIGFNNPAFLYFLDMGLGKTNICLKLLSYLKENDKLKKALVLVPNTPAIDSWSEETTKHSDLTCIGLYGTKQERLEKLKIPAELYALNYTGLQILLTDNVKNKKTGKGEWVPNKQAIKEFAQQFNVVIFDEIHLAKSHVSLTFKLCNELSNHCKYRYGLTGTPFGRCLEDLWAQFYLVDRGETLGSTITMYRDAYFTAKRNHWGGVDYKFKKEYEEDIHKRILNKSIRYTKKECLDLPDKIYKPLYLKLPLATMQYYKQVMQGIVESKGNHTIIKNSFIRLREISDGFLTIKDEDGDKQIITFAENPKLELLIELIQQTPEEAKVVVFNEFIYSGDMIEAALKKNKITYERLYSGTKNKIEAKRNFVNDKKCKAFLGNVQSCNTNLNLQVANYEIYYSCPTSPIVRKQSEDRCHRPGLEGTLFVYDLVMKNTVDEKILFYLREGKDLFEAIMQDENLLLS